MTNIHTGHDAALGNERGSTIVFVSLAMAALLSMVALAVDIGMLYTARGEAQRAADAAALAGAHSLIEIPPSSAGSEQAAKSVAEATGEQNTVGSEPVSIDPEEDVEVDLANWQVTVTVRRTSERGNPVATWFARVFGIDVADVAAVATAEVRTANAGTCLKPFTIPDAWDDVDDDGKYDAGEKYVAAETGYGSAFRNGMGSGTDLLPWNQIDPLGTTYEYDYGRPMIIKPGSPGEAVVDSWYFPWNVPNVGSDPLTGADRYRNNIAKCNPSIVKVGEEYMVETGNMDGPTIQGTLDLIEQDPDAYWDIETDQVVDSNYDPWYNSPRKTFIPLYDPRWPVQPGKKPIQFNNITAFWVDGIKKDKGKESIVGRFLFAAGFADGTGTGDPGGAGNELKYVRLIQ